MTGVHLANECAKEQRSRNHDVPVMAPMGGRTQRDADADTQEPGADPLIIDALVRRNDDLAARCRRADIPIAIEDPAEPRRDQIAGHLQDACIEGPQRVTEELVIDRRRPAVPERFRMRTLWQNDVEMLLVEVKPGGVTEFSLEDSTNALMQGGLGVHESNRTIIFTTEVAVGLDQPAHIGHVFRDLEREAIKA